ncbi:hypothetical protein [Campylobacter phage CJLB-7]|nr:hypothetical protein [Campylobacter phage CJLB-7]
MGKLIALMGDLHFGCKNFDHDILEVQLNSLEKYRDILKEKGCSTIYQLGDMFDNRKLIDLKLLHTLSTRFKTIFEGFDFYTFAGNHDMYNRDNRDIVSSELFADLLGIKYIKEPSYHVFGKHKIGISPWLCGDEELLKECDILLGHAELKGFKYNHTSIAEEGLNIDNSKYKKVYMGHYHFNQNNVYIGTPYQMTFNEVNSIPGIILLNENLEEEFVENTWDRRHFTVTVLKDKVILQYKDEPELFTGNFPDFCKVGKIILEEKNEKEDKILEYFGARARISKVFYKYEEEKLYESVSLNNSVAESLDFIKEYILKEHRHLESVLNDVINN